MQQHNNYYSHLSQEERLKIFLLYNKGYSFREIGKILSRSHTTISREFRRNSKDLGRDRYKYHPIKAQKQYQKRRDKAGWRKHIFIKDPRLRGWLYKELKNKGTSWGVDEIIGRWELEYGIKPCSVSTVYRWLRLIGGEYERILRYKGFGYRQKKGSKQGKSYQDIPYIIMRSKENEERLEIGHFECDTVVSNREGKGGLLTMVDRKSRYLLLHKVENLLGESIYHAMYMKLKDKKHISLTIDNGKEFSKIRRFKKKGIEIYRCHPYSSYEKGTNETHNRMIRWWIYKGCDISQESNSKIIEVENLLNHKPRKILGYRSPYEVYYNKELKYFN